MVSTEHTRVMEHMAMSRNNKPRNLFPAIAVTLLFAGIFWQMYSYRQESLRNAASFRESVDNIKTVEEYTNEYYDDEMLERINNYGKLDGSTLEFEGKTYKRVDSVHAILLLGIDKDGPMELNNVAGAAGQSDAIYLVAQDVARDKVKILMIPRDTITLIRLYDIMGNELGVGPQHINLQFAYGDGGDKSLYLAKEAVSNLLFGLKLNGAMAVNRPVVQVLNDDLGGVPVTINFDGLEDRDPAFKKGATVTLTGPQAEMFVRHRDCDTSGSALTRLEQQKTYIEAFEKTLRAKAAKDSDLIPRMMKDLEVYMLTDMPKGQYMDMAVSCLNSKDLLTDEDFIMAPGESVEGPWFDEYYIDEEKLKKEVIGLFYKEVN